MAPGVPLVVSQVNPDDAALHEGIVANPNCSTMQLAPVLMALRDAVGLERVVVDTYQSVSAGPARRDRRARGPGPRPRRRRAADRLGLPAPDRVQRAARDRRLPRQRLHEGGVEGRHGEPQDPPPAGAPDLVHGRPDPGLDEPLRGGPRRDPRPDLARAGPRAVRGRPGGGRPGRPGRPRLSTRDRRRRPRRDLRRPGAPRPVDRRRSRPRPVGRERQPAQGCRDECGRDRPRSSSTGAGSGRPRPGPPSGARCDRPWARRRARGDRGGDPRLHPLPPPRDARQDRAGGGQPGHRGRVRRRGPGSRREPGRPAVRGRLRPAADRAHRVGRLAARRRVHHERREVLATRQPRPPARRDRRLRAVPPAPARRARPGGRGDRRQALARRVHARRADRPGPRDGASGGSGDRRPRRARVRDVPPGVRAVRRLEPVHARDRHRRAARRRCSPPGPGASERLGGPSAADGARAASRPRTGASRTAERRPRGAEAVPRPTPGTRSDAGTSTSPRSGRHGRTARAISGQPSEPDTDQLTLF